MTGVRLVSIPQVLSLTSLALGGATIGSDALGVTGTANISGALTAGSTINATSTIISQASLRAPILSGGNASGSALVVQSTSGAGTTDSITFRTASQVTALTIDTNQKVAVASGKVFQLGNAATTGLGAGLLAATTNATIVISDSGGQAYRIPCII